MDKILFKEEWLSIKQNNGYSYLHEEKCNGILMAFLPIKNVNGKLQYLMRREKCPAHGNEQEFCGIIGGYDDNTITIEETALKELKEESGYSIDKIDLESLGWVWDSKVADTKVYLFSANVSHYIQGIATTDGTELEKNSSCEWVTLDKCMETKDSKVHVILNKMQYERSKYNG
jgi:8-oxo-dGTP pyrophosphatase MutT (NUDIX family)